MKKNFNIIFLLYLMIAGIDLSASSSPKKTPRLRDNASKNTVASKQQDADTDAESDVPAESSENEEKKLKKKKAKFK